MIHEIDEALRLIVLRDTLDGTGVDLSFDAPTKDWAARRNAPTVNVYLYDIREDVERRDVIPEPVRGENGRIVARKAPPRVYRLSYLVTAWTQRPEDEHHLLASLLAALSQHPRLPDDVLTGSLSGQEHPVTAQVAMPPPKDRAFADVWSALGGELKPSLDLVVVAPLDAQKVLEVGPPVLQELTLRVNRQDTEQIEEVGGPRQR